jgi:hypothetical protein
VYFGDPGGAARELTGGSSSQGAVRVVPLGQENGREEGPRGGALEHAPPRDIPQPMIAAVS